MSDRLSKRLSCAVKWRTDFASDEVREVEAVCA